MAFDRPPAGSAAPGRTWVDWATLVLVSLAAPAVFIMPLTVLVEPHEGYIVKLDVQSGGGSSCTSVGRPMHCHNDIDFSDLEPDSGGLDMDDLECHQVAFRHPFSLRTGYDCVDKETWQGLEAGDFYRQLGR
jgi:hypothetical protein